MPRQLVNIIIAFVLLPACGQSTYEEKLESLYRGTVPFIKIEEVASRKKINENIIILDTRSFKEYTVSHIPGATLVDFETFSSDALKDIDKASEVLVYCSVGYRSERIGEKMIDLGFTNVKNIYGGIFEWKNKDQEVIDNNGDVTDSVHTYNKEWSKWLKKGIKVYE